MKTPSPTVCFAIAFILFAPVAYWGGYSRAIKLNDPRLTMHGFLWKGNFGECQIVPDPTSIITQRGPNNETEQITLIFTKKNWTSVGTLNNRLLEPQPMNKVFEDVAKIGAYGAISDGLGRMMNLPDPNMAVPNSKEYSIMYLSDHYEEFPRSTYLWDGTIKLEDK